MGLAICRSIAQQHDGCIWAESILGEGSTFFLTLPSLPEEQPEPPDGAATFQKLQDDATTQGIPVILLTAKVQSSDRLRFAEMGVVGVIAKPFDPISLDSQVAQILGWSQ